MWYMLNFDVLTPLDNITTVRPLAKSLFKSLFSSSEIFGQIRDKIGLLVAVLDGTEEHTQGVHTDTEQIPGLKEALDHRMKIERMLRDFMNEIRTGKRESSTLSTVSLSADEKEEWRQLRKELQSIGITPEIFNEIGCLKQKQPTEEESFLGPPCDVAGGSLKSDSQGDMVALPQQIRPIAIPVSAAQPHASSNSAPVAEKSNEMVYEGYTFFKADPINGTKATWIYVERTRICLPQNEISIKVQKRAHRKSAAQQYQDLSDTHQGHVDQRIHERQKGDPSVEWMCVYVKERERPTNRDRKFIYFASQLDETTCIEKPSCFSP
ncbi:uncharacterized protein N7484_008646 [Penicillium longicatenatum]|uniref:uncharacterized protein n=1 Tax=Penicillium longicatenatum TaxID=1561947 RepID=UPI002547E27A|nr:uncharacterized protein N7484_008646 [Penicillium longicatenatum]KAJ5635333.1 hypothetical protein N7484_008646 [Penicillium longicatenatum]